MNLSTVIYAEIKIHQSPSIQIHRSVAKSKRARERERERERATSKARE
jgi:hypothetical protein